MDEAAFQAPCIIFFVSCDSTGANTVSSSSIHPWFAAIGMLIICSGGGEGEGWGSLSQFSLLVDVSRCLGGTAALLPHDCSQIMARRRTRTLIASVRRRASILDALGNAADSPSAQPPRVREVNNMDHSRGAVLCLERLAFLGMFFGSQPSPALFHTE